MNQKTFKITKSIRMQHCDPGGIVFTPQYFNLFIEVIEDWFESELNYPFKQMITIDSSGIPLMKVNARFHNPSFLGDRLEFQLNVVKIRGTTVLLSISSYVDKERRCSMEVLYGFRKKSSQGLAPWPDFLKRKMEEFYK